MADLKNTILEPEIINHKGWLLYHPERAPSHEMVMAHWADNSIAVSYRDDLGTWWLAKIGDPAPMWVKTAVPLIGWLHLPRAL